MFSQDSHFWGTFKKFRLFSLLEQKAGMKNHSAFPDLWFQTCAFVPTHPPCRRRASPASCALWGDVTRRRWSGRRRSSEAGRAGKGNVALHTLSLHCDPWPPPPLHPHPQQGPYEHWRGRLDDLNERLFFYSRVITFVKTPTEYLQSDRPLDFFCF